MDFLINKIIMLGTVIFAGYAFMLIFKKQYLHLILLIIGISVLMNILTEPVKFFNMLGDLIVKGATEKWLF